MVLSGSPSRVVKVVSWPLRHRLNPPPAVPIQSVPWASRYSVRIQSLSSPAPFSNERAPHP